MPPARKLGRKTDDEPGVHVERTLTDIKLLDRCRVWVETEVDGREAAASLMGAGVTPPKDKTMRYGQKKSPSPRTCKKCANMPPTTGRRPRSGSSLESPTSPAPKLKPSHARCTSCGSKAGTQPCRCSQSHTSCQSRNKEAAEETRHSAARCNCQPRGVHVGFEEGGLGRTNELVGGTPCASNHFAPELKCVFLISGT